MANHDSLSPQPDGGAFTVRLTKMTVSDRVLRNLRQQTGVYCLEPGEKFHLVETQSNGYSAFFTGYEIRLTENYFDDTHEINSHRYLYLLADNHYRWCLYKFHFHTYIKCGTSISKRSLELVPYDSIDGSFFAVNYLDVWQ